MDFGILILVFVTGGRGGDLEFVICYLEFFKRGAEFGIYHLEFLKEDMDPVKEDSDTVTAAIDTMKEDGKAVNAVSAIW